MPEDDITLLDLIPLFAAETEETIFGRMAASANEGLTVDDIDDWIDVRPGAHFFTWAMPGARELARAYDLFGSEVIAAVIPVLSWGTYLDYIAASYKVERLAATHAAGRVTFVGEPGQAINAGARVGAESISLDEPQKEYEVLEGGVIGEPLGPPENPAATTESSGGGLADADHYYVIATLNSEGESTISAEKKVTLAVGGDGVINLTWDPVVGATGYRVYHGTIPGGPYSRVADVVTEAYKDDGTPVPDETLHPSETDTTGGRITLPVDAIEAGVAFNANAGEVTVQISEGTADEVTNADAIAGGTDPETDIALLGRLEARFEGIGQGNTKAYKVWAGEVPGVGRVAVIPDWEGSGTVLVIVLTANGDPVSAEVVEAVQIWLDPVKGKAEGKAPIGHDVTVTTATGVPIDVEAKIEFETGYSLDGAAGTVAMEETLAAAISDYIESSEPGTEVVRQKIIARIASFEGVHDVGTVKLNGAAANITLDSDPAEVGELDTLTLTEGAV